jgi:hypothetical protein
MTLSGRVEDHGLADILRNLIRSRDTAFVTMEREGVRKAVHVQLGRIVFAQSGDKDDRLGECLLREGMISVEQYEESGRLIRPGKRQGTILVELGYITPGELVKGVKLQVEHVVSDLLSWRQGAYRMSMRELELRDIITLNISTENLLFHGIKRGAGWSQVMRGLGGTLDSVLERAQDSDTRLYKLDLSEDESHVVSLVNGRLSAAQICSMSYLSNHDTCLALFALSCCGVVEVGHPRDPETLFREQVTEAELQEVRDLVAGMNDALQRATPHLHAAGITGPQAQSALERLDEHWDVLRQVQLTQGRIDAQVVVENVRDVEPGARRALVERALAALRRSLAALAGPAEDRRRIEDALAAAPTQGSAP